MKKSTLLLLISTALFFTSTLVLLYLNYLKPTPTSTPTTGIIPTEESIPTAIPTVDPTVNWKTYENKELGFSLEIPNNLITKLPSNSTKTDFWNQSDDTAEYYKYYRNILLNDPGNYKTPLFWIYIDGNSIKALQGVEDGPSNLHFIKKYNQIFNLYSFGQEFVDQVCATEKNGKTIVISCNEKNLSDPLFNQILSTFKFTDTNSSSSSNKTREIFTDDKCLSITIYKPKSTNLSLAEYINKIYNLNSKLPLYETQYKINDLESITIPAMNAEEISNTYVKKGESIIWILVENNIPQGPPTCKSDYSQELKNIIQSLQL